MDTCTQVPQKWRGLSVGGRSALCLPIIITMGLLQFLSRCKLPSRQSTKTMAHTPRRHKRYRLPAAYTVSPARRESESSSSSRSNVVVRRSSRLEGVRKSTMAPSAATPSPTSRSGAAAAVVTPDSQFGRSTVKRVHVRPGTALHSTLPEARLPPLPTGNPPPPTELLQWIFMGPPQAGKTALISSFCQREYTSSAGTAGTAQLETTDDAINKQATLDSPRESITAAAKANTVTDLAYSKKDYAFCSNGNTRSVRLQLYDVQVDLDQPPPQWLLNLWKRCHGFLLVIPLTLSWSDQVTHWVSWLRSHSIETEPRDGEPSSLPAIHLLLSQVDLYQDKWTNLDYYRVQQHVRDQCMIQGLSSMHFTTATLADTRICVTMDTVARDLLSNPMQLYSPVETNEDTTSVSTQDVTTLLELPKLCPFSTPQKSMPLLTPVTPGTPMSPEMAE
jgi:hypothetical protein